MAFRYSQGWRDPEQDRKPPPRIELIRGQKYDDVKKDCKARDILWEDPIFRAEDLSVFPKGGCSKTIQWRRPRDICTNPQMFVDGFDMSDVQQGDLGNSWFLAAIVSLCATKDKALFYKVVPRDNAFDNGSYTGTFHFQFCHNGEWLDVVVDDRLPTYEGQLAFVHSTANNEFWPALLEKAYAKLFGSYQALKRGSSGQVMQHFTGGVTETFDLDGDVPRDLFTVMRKGFERSSMLRGFINSKNRKGVRHLSNGLVTDHGYSITSVKQIALRSGTSVNLVRLRDPFGGNSEWKGAWSDGSPEWQNIPNGLAFENDGEFWMSINDFVTNFSHLEMCMTVMKMSVGSKVTWDVTSHEGSWMKFVNAGGCLERNGTPQAPTFWTNPQYEVRVISPDENDSTGTLIVVLSQKDRRKSNAELGENMPAIGYFIYNNDDANAGPRSRRYFEGHRPVASTPTLVSEQEVLGRHKLPPGRYIIVATTSQPNEEGDFRLRIFSENPAPSVEMDDGTFHDENLAAKTEVRQNDCEIVKLFDNAAGDNNEVDAYELRTFLDGHLRVEFKMAGLSLEMARSMVALMDINRSGTLDREEFKKLWAELRRWKEIFLKYVVPNANKISSFDMRAALRASGLYVSNRTLKCIVTRYTDPEGYIQFDDFMLCVIRLKTMFESFQPEMNQRMATFTLDKVIQYTMYA